MQWRRRVKFPKKNKATRSSKKRKKKNWKKGPPNNQRKNSLVKRGKRFQTGGNLKGGRDRIKEKKRELGSGGLTTQMRPAMQTHEHATVKRQGGTRLGVRQREKTRESPDGENPQGKKK